MNKDCDDGARVSSTQTMNRPLLVTRCRAVILAVIAPLTVTSASIADPVGGSPILLDRVVAFVDDVPIFRSDVRSRALHVGGALPKEHALREAKLRDLETSALATLIEEALIAKAVASEHIDVSDADVDAALANAFGTTDVRQLEQAATARGYSLREYRRLMRLEVLTARWLVAHKPATLHPSAPNFDAELAKLRASLLAEVRERTIIEVR